MNTRQDCERIALAGAPYPYPTPMPDDARQGHTAALKRQQMVAPIWMLLSALSFGLGWMAIYFFLSDDLTSMSLFAALVVVAVGVGAGYWKYFRHSKRAGLHQAVLSAYPIVDL